MAAIGLGLLAPLARGVAPGRFQFREVSPVSLGLWEGEAPVLVYNHGIISREGAPAAMARACYIHPLYALDGSVITDDFPPDHLHHRGLFWGWPHIRRGDKEYDSWSPTPRFALRFERWLAREAGENRAALAVENGWYADGERIAREEVRITALPASSSARAIDVELTWTALGAPISLEGAESKSYGGLTLRFATQSDATITVPSGRTSADLAIARLPWADFTATFPGAAGRGGAAILIHPSHPDYPPTWLTRHYGALCVGWPGVTPGTLEPERPTRCRYRIWIHRGDASPATVEAAYHSFISSAADAD